MMWGDELPPKRTPHCRHCGDPYPLADEHPDTRYAGMCPSCVEADQESERRDLEERDLEDSLARRRFYNG